MLQLGFIVIDVSRAIWQCGDRLAYQREVAAVRFEHNQRHSVVPRVRNESLDQCRTRIVSYIIYVASANQRRECSAEMTDECHVAIISAHNSNQPHFPRLIHANECAGQGWSQAGGNDSVSIGELIRSLHYHSAIAQLNFQKMLFNFL